MISYLILLFLIQIVRHIHCSAKRPTLSLFLLEFGAEDMDTDANVDSSQARVWIISINLLFIRLQYEQIF